MMSCRVFWSRLWLPSEINKNKMMVEKDISNIAGVELVVSCLTGTSTNAKSSTNSENGGENTAEVKKGNAFFIVMRTEAVEDDVIKLIHDCGVQDQNFSYIRPRGKSRDSKELALSSLKQVVKV